MILLQLTLPLSRTIFFYLYFALSLYTCIFRLNSALFPEIHYRRSITTTDYREIIKLKNLNFSNVTIANSLYCSHNTVSKAIKLAKTHSLEWPIPEVLTNSDINHCFKSINLFSTLSISSIRDFILK